MRPPRTTRRGLLVGGTVALAGCGLRPGESEPIEATATTPAELPEAAATEAGYSLETEDERTIETTVTAEISGDVETTARREVNATVFRRVYTDGASARFGVVTAPLVDLLEGSELRRDPVIALDDATAIEHATGRAISDPTADGDVSVVLLGAETTGVRLGGTVDGTAVSVVRASVSAGEDGVTAVALVPSSGTVPSLFEDVRRGE
ncbi:hypothetical protein KM295_11315 [Natronomonas sp. F2-12]|jgi:hypothetical protein|uniref:Uncharacterized protein n=1 Tax=Natronomonas aquatica TaxID=2841590 RepID=A0A9R1CUX1_9EURY|nr:DUF6517 family protein [Natronomonas aquatica]MCQ4334056.1 hypothetical protein [Natronomonas aquatica]